MGNLPVLYRSHPVLQLCSGTSPADSARCVSALTLRTAGFLAGPLRGARRSLGGGGRRLHRRGVARSPGQGPGAPLGGHDGRSGVEPASFLTKRSHMRDAVAGALDGDRLGEGRHALGAACEANTTRDRYWGEGDLFARVGQRARSAIATKTRLALRTASTSWSSEWRATRSSCI